MAADTVISGVIRGILPYAVIGAAGFVGYTYLRKKGVLKDVQNVADNVFRAPQIIVKKIQEVTDKVPTLPDNPIIPNPTRVDVIKNDDGIDGYSVERNSILEVGYDGFSDYIDRTAAAGQAAASGNWIEAGQNLARNVPTIYAAEKLVNRLFGR